MFFASALSADSITASPSLPGPQSWQSIADQY